MPSLLVDVGKKSLDVVSMSTETMATTNLFCFS